MSTIIDTSALVALLDRRDSYHTWCKRQASKLDYPFFTCEGVLTEAFHLLRGTNTGHRSLLELLARELIKVSFEYKEHKAQIHKILTSYQDLPASFADACLVCMAETTKRPRIFTLDRDFTIYRTTKGEPLSLISPF